MGFATADAELVDDVIRRVCPLLLASGRSPGDISVHLEHDGPRLTVAIGGVPPEATVQHALTVKVLQAVAAGAVTRGDVQVRFERPTTRTS